MGVQESLVVESLLVGSYGPSDACSSELPAPPFVVGTATNAEAAEAGLVRTMSYSLDPVEDEDF